MILNMHNLILSMWNLLDRYQFQKAVFRRTCISIQMTPNRATQVMICLKRFLERDYNDGEKFICCVQDDEMIEARARKTQLTLCLWLTFKRFIIHEYLRKQKVNRNGKRPWKPNISLMENGLGLIQIFHPRRNPLVANGCTKLRTR